MFDYRRYPVQPCGYHGLEVDALVFQQPRLSVVNVDIDPDTLRSRTTCPSVRLFTDEVDDLPFRTLKRAVVPVLLRCVSDEPLVPTVTFSVTPPVIAPTAFATS